MNVDGWIVIGARLPRYARRSTMGGRELEVVSVKVGLR